MSTNWLRTALKRQKEGAEKSSGSEASETGAAQENTSTETIPLNGRGNAATKFGGDLQTLEDIYRAAGILNPRMGYSIGKVVEMIHSDHMRGLPKDARRAAILMALDAASISVEEILRDAAQRQQALEAYEAGQRKSFEEYWARKAEANAQIQAETEQIVAQNQERIERNREEVAREKAEFARWQEMKQQEAERIAEAVGLCSKEPKESSSEKGPTDAKLPLAGMESALGREAATVSKPS
jgi:hypothetical protein